MRRKDSVLLTRPDRNLRSGGVDFPAPQPSYFVSTCMSFLNPSVVSQSVILPFQSGLVVQPTSPPTGRSRYTRKSAVGSPLSLITATGPPIGSVFLFSPVRV